MWFRSPYMPMVNAKDKVNSADAACISDVMLRNEKTRNDFAGCIYPRSCSND